MAISKAIDFGSLVGAQLAALIEAEVEGAEKTAEFIESVGFEKNDDDELTLRMVAFNMTRRDVDGQSRLHVIRIPVLTLVPIPLLTIETADIEFEARVESIHSTKTESPPTRTGGSLLLNRPRNRLFTRLARTTKEDTTTKSDLKISVKISSSPFPVGIERILNTADLSVEDETP